METRTRDAQMRVSWGEGLFGRFRPYIIRIPDRRRLYLRQINIEKLMRFDCVADIFPGDNSQGQAGGDFYSTVLPTINLTSMVYSYRT